MLARVVITTTNGNASQMDDLESTNNKPRTQAPRPRFAPIKRSRRLPQSAREPVKGRNNAYGDSRTKVRSATKVADFVKLYAITIKETMYNQSASSEADCPRKMRSKARFPRSTPYGLIS